MLPSPCHSYCLTCPICCHPPCPSPCSDPCPSLRPVLSYSVHHVLTFFLLSLPSISSPSLPSNLSCLSLPLSCPQILSTVALPPTVPSALAPALRPAISNVSSAVPTLSLTPYISLCLSPSSAITHLHPAFPALRLAMPPALSYPPLVLTISCSALPSFFFINARSATLNTAFYN